MPALCYVAVGSCNECLAMSPYCVLIVPCELLQARCVMIYVLTDVPSTEQCIALCCEGAPLDACFFVHGQTNTIAQLAF